MLPQLIDEAARKLGFVLHSEQRAVCMNYRRWKKDTFLIAPTGFGKSLPYTLCPLLYDKPGKVIIISPTTALINDNILKLQRNIPEYRAVHLTQANLENAKDAVYIFATPESMLAEDCGQVLLTDQSWVSEVNALFIDEAHLILQWGTTDWERDVAFRAAYSELGRLRTFIDIPIIAMSATVTNHTAEIIAEILSMSTYDKIEVNINRPNIMYHLTAQQGNLTDFNWIVKLLTTGVHIPRTLVFFTSRHTMNEAYAYIISLSNFQYGDPENPVVMYHSLTQHHIQSRIIRDLNDDDGCVKIVLCTSSMSIGVSLIDIEYIVHYGLPPNTLDFLQASGRAARESESQGHSIAIKFPGMFAGHRPTIQMRTLPNQKRCLREHLLEGFVMDGDVEKPKLCCVRCNPNYSDPLLDLIMSGAEVSDSDSSSDNHSAFSDASVHDIQDWDFY